jgi:hypothetical protein
VSFFNLRDPIGDSAIAGDMRWAGSYGVNIDFVARSHCAVEVIPIEEIQVLAHSIDLMSIHWLQWTIMLFHCGGVNEYLKIKRS